jgi:NO-binding membrane sensor protein with MHYT domain
MAEVRHFTFGPVSPVLAVVSATLGCLLGIILMTKAQKVSGGRRVRLLTYATVAIAVTAVWQSNVLALIGLDVPGTTLRLEPMRILVSLGLAIASVGAGLFLVSYGGAGPFRLVAAGGLIGLGMAGAHVLIVGAVRLGGVVTYDQSLLLASVVMAMVVACALLWFVLSLRGLGPAIAAAFACALAIVSVHYVGEYAVGVHSGPVPGLLPAPATGLAPLTVAMPTLVLGGVLSAMLWFFSVGTSTTRDLRSVFSPGEHSGQIEPWVIAAVTRRVATAPPGPDDATVALRVGNARRSRLPGLMPVFRSVQVARTLDPHTEPPTPVQPLRPPGLPNHSTVYATRPPSPAGGATVYGSRPPAPAPFPSPPAPAPATPRPGPVPAPATPPPATGWPDRVPVPSVRTPEPARAKDRNVRAPMEVRSAEERTATLRRVSTVHREAPPTANVAPISPAPGLPVRTRPSTATLADSTEPDTLRPRNRRHPR